MFYNMGWGIPSFTELAENDLNIWIGSQGFWVDFWESLWPLMEVNLEDDCWNAELLIKLEETVTLNSSVPYKSPQIIRISRLYLLEIILTSPMYSNASYIVYLLRVIWTVLGTGITEVFIPALRSLRFGIMFCSS